MYLEILNNLKPKSIWDDAIYSDYVRLSPGVKGKFGENCVKAKLLDLGKELKIPENTDYDVWFDDMKWEVKTSGLNASGTFMWNQIKFKTEATHFILVAVEPNNIRMFKIPTSDFEQIVNKHVSTSQHRNEEKLWAVKPEDFYFEVNEYETTESGLSTISENSI